FWDISTGRTVLRSIRMLRALILAIFWLVALPAMAPATETPDGVPAPSATPSEIEQADSDVDPTSKLKAWTFVNTYTGATYGPASLRILQIVPREEVVKVASALLRINFPSMNAIDGVDSGFG